jgi:hypothetical protein
LKFSDKLVATDFDRAQSEAAARDRPSSGRIGEKGKLGVRARPSQERHALLKRGVGLVMAGAAVQLMRNFFA